MKQEVLTLTNSSWRYALLMCGFICSMIFLFASVGLAQTAATGALNGGVYDPNHAVIAGAQLKATNESTGETRVTVAKEDGSYALALLSPGSYQVELTAKGFKKATRASVRVNITETTTVNFQLEVGAISETITVTEGGLLAQLDSNSLGRVIDDKALSGLPLATRNYTQIIALSPGIVTDVSNATDVGRGNGGLTPFFSSTGIYSHGVRATDNNFQMNGAQINDLQGTGSTSGGVAIPNPDTIEQFKVQTGQYDASFGRGAGANVNLVTKGGSKEFHGTGFEFFRNDALNANDFFANRNGQRRPVLRQNQFGFNLGGPAGRDDLRFFTSYQGTRQVNGAAAQCQRTLVTPPLTNDRSREALGRLFGGQKGAFGGVAVAADGSNINPIALRLLQQRMENGQFLIPTPQRISNGQGTSFISRACSFNEDQFMINGDYQHSERSNSSIRFFNARGNYLLPLPAVNGVPGFPLKQKDTFRNLTLSNSYTLGTSAVNEIRFGYHRIIAASSQEVPFKFSDIGVNAAPQANQLPSITIGSLSLASFGQSRFLQDHFNLEDNFSVAFGKHTMRFGGGLNRAKVNLDQFDFPAGLTFLSFPDFLLGLNGANNGTQFFSNVFVTADFLGTPQRRWRVWDGWAYFQDDLKITKRLTFNVGLRYEKIGQFFDRLGRNANLRISQLNQNPPATGTLEGYAVPTNYSGVGLPAGVGRIGNGFGVDGAGQNKLAPRLGLAWQVLPRSDRLVLRGGYGVYYNRPRGQAILQLAQNPPFSTFRVSAGTANANATFQNPFPQPLLNSTDFPRFTPYSTTTQLSTTLLAADYQPAVIQQFGLNLQLLTAKDWLLEVGYAGTRMTHQAHTRTLNQALLVSPENPIRGLTTNTLSNLSRRVPYVGWQAGGLKELETSGAGWYHGLETSLTKRLSQGLQFLISYTFSKTTDTDGANPVGSGSGQLIPGDQNNPRARYGPTSYNRPHRFVASYLYELPKLRQGTGFVGGLANGWSLSGTATIQSGQSLSITGTNGNNIYGITSDYAQLAPGCTHSQLVNPGGPARNITNYFNKSCFTNWLIIGDPEPTGGRRATAFGNSGVGIVSGPSQKNLDIAVIKRTKMPWPKENATIEFRTEFFNALNTPQFANPDTNFSSPTFGVIRSGAVNPRVIQFGLKLSF
jgi:hypothetical protein